MHRKKDFNREEEKYELGNLLKRYRAFKAIVENTKIDIEEALEQSESEEHLHTLYQKKSAAHENIDKIERYLERLSPHERKFIEAMCFDKLSYKEAAELFNLTFPTNVSVIRNFILEGMIEDSRERSTKGDNEERGRGTN